jgi:alcohol oxidase
MKQSGYAEVEDLQDLSSNNAVSTARRFVSADTGERQDTAHTYLQPRLQDESNKNLYVLSQTQVIRILVDNDKRASCVEYRANPAFEAPKSTKTTIKARKLVIVAAGTLGTPQILERSGIGNIDVLLRAGVPVIADLPGVGHDYQDHHMVLVTYKSTLTPEQSVDSVINGALNTTELLTTNADILSWNGVDASSKIRPSEEDVAGFKSELQKVWESSFANVPNRPLGSLVLVAGYASHLTFAVLRLTSIVAFLAIPLHIQAGVNTSQWAVTARILDLEGMW